MCTCLLSQVIVVVVGILGWSRLIYWTICNADVKGKLCWMLERIIFVCCSKTRRDVGSLTDLFDLFITALKHCDRVLMNREWILNRVFYMLCLVFFCSYCSHGKVHLRTSTLIISHDSVGTTMTATVIKKISNTF